VRWPIGHEVELAACRRMAAPGGQHEGVDVLLGVREHLRRERRVAHRRVLGHLATGGDGHAARHSRSVVVDLGEHALADLFVHLYQGDRTRVCAGARIPQPPP
jgi:hypothetical protein